MALPARVTIVEVGPRDGFQMEKTFIPTETKVAIIDALVRAGIHRMEVTSFVSPKVIEQMRDAEEVMRAVDRTRGVVYIGLVPNLKGAQRAIAAGVNAMKIVICPSESYNLRNVGMTVEESLRTCEELIALGRANDVETEVVIGLSFGCPLEGHIPEDCIVDLTRRVVAMDYSEVSIADSIGVANPSQVRRMMRRLQDEFPRVHFSLHLHNTRGLGLANVLAALEEGIDTFDSSIGGLGGSPVVVAGATGNIPTEDLVNMLNEMGLATDIDTEGVMVAARMAQDFLGRPLPSFVLAAGTRERLFRRARERREAQRATG